MNIRVIAFSLYGSTAASTRYRLEQYKTGLRSYGIELIIEPLLSDEYIRRSYQGKRYSVFAYLKDYFHRLGGVMPLFDDEWAKGKCGFKLIQYMACSVPVVGSAVGANVDVISSDCGFLVKTTQDWINAIRVLSDDSHLRDRMGACSRMRVMQHSGGQSVFRAGAGC